MHDPWQQHAPTLHAPWHSGPAVPLHGVHEVFTQGPIDAPPMFALVQWVALAEARARQCAAGSDDAPAWRTVAWVGAMVAPPLLALARHGLDLDEHIVVHGARAPLERLWAFEEAVRSCRCCAVVVDASDWSQPMARRAQLASSWHEGRPSVLALAWKPWRQTSQRSCCTTRWCVRPVSGTASMGAAWSVTLVRDRRGGLDACAPHDAPLHETWACSGS